MCTNKELYENGYRSNEVQFQYEFLIEEGIPYLVNSINRVKEYKITCIDSTSTLISVEGLTFTDRIRMYTKNIKGFDKDQMKKILPECYI